MHMLFWGGPKWVWTLGEGHANVPTKASRNLGTASPLRSRISNTHTSPTTEAAHSESSVAPPLQLLLLLLPMEFKLIRLHVLADMPACL